MLTESFIKTCETALIAEESRIEKWFQLNSRPASVNGFEPEHVFSATVVDQQNHRNVSERLVDVKEALTKIKQENFGVCVECKEEIPEERLLLMPYAKKCLTCQKNHEAGQGSRQRRYFQ